ncbi:MAG: hypothetical protein ABSG76_12265, partial [Xanthobacteraceae bacterium]
PRASCPTHQHVTDTAMGHHEIALPADAIGVSLREVFPGPERRAVRYLAGVSWEPRDALERRAAALLPALFLARIDGKSPVEYVVDEGDRSLVRTAARKLIAEPVAELPEIMRRWTGAARTR